MKDIDHLRNELLANTNDFARLVASLADTWINRKAENGGWSMAEIIEHLVLVESGIVREFDGTGGKTGRPLLQKVELIKSAFDTPGNRYESPREFLPTAKTQSKVIMLEKLAENRNLVLAKLPGLDLSETLVNFRHPYAGRLTRIEWIYFIVIHAQRHFRQVEKLLLSLGIR